MHVLYTSFVLRTQLLAPISLVVCQDEYCVAAISAAAPCVAVYRYDVLLWVSIASYNEYALANAATVTAEDTAYSVTITTVPSQGPFRIGQTVQFSCLIEPTPPDPVTYRWRIVEYARIGHTHTQQNYSRSFYNRNLHYCYYLCEVSVNQTLLGSASRIVEVQGEYNREDQSY